MSNKQIKNRLELLRKLMRQNNIDAYIIPTNDFHGSEYVGEYFACRKFISGFTGSAGTCIVTIDEAGLWTDGRYFLQAEEELKNTSIDLYKMGEANVLTILEFLDQKLDNNSTIGFDGRVLSIGFVKNLMNKLKNKNIKYNFELDLIDQIWENRPNMSSNKVFELSIDYAGEERISKINKIKNELKNNQADYLILTSLDDIAWLLNLRGSDVECNPVFLSYVLISKDEVVLYIDEKKIPTSILNNLNKDEILIKPYNIIYQDIKEIEEDKVVLFDEYKVNYAIKANLKTKNIINKINPTTIYKAIKNETEIKNAYLAHLKDGIALTKFIYYIKHNINKKSFTEISASDYLENLRKEQPNYIGLSFDTISGYAHHGAIIHYSATKESNIELSPKSFLLVDSGGQYLEGTTDVTRTISLGELTEKEKTYYTLVLKGHLALSNIIFPEGVSGINLDVLARASLWKNLLNYNHGTGHGVGSLLNVHEGPQNISPYQGRASYPFKPGMITSNEPGIYLENEFGIRIENLILCKNYQESNIGKFLCFDDLTLAPYEVDAIDKSLLTKEEINQIHNYHEKVYNQLSSYLNEEEKNWLKQIVEDI